ncbi:DUF2516 family protein [Pengzhenrongella frigida]|uniref:DUF2516 family protein n=1 Tax=Pengzhenrongella frigida TaxID=1259133 RepID=A0A4Q5N047_9MICO|nr:DUF2516 family protein [Cellulomonas sp. HLT2-17]RYV50583.1 DUF2516 family protein [Cellulomonas sp. HLT2-17]
MIRSLQILVYFALYFTVFVFAAWALVDALTRPAGAFVSAGKRTKNFWLAVTGAATAVAFVAIPAPIGLGAFSFLALAAAVGGIVYLVDVRPAVRPYSGRRGRGQGGGGKSPRGGW